MKYFVLLYTLFFTILDYTHAQGQVVPLESFRRLNVNNPVVRRWAMQGIAVLGQQRNKTFVLVRVVSADARYELDVNGTERVRRRVDSDARMANCNRPGRCIREVFTVILRYFNGTQIINVI
uniref:Cystatin domain-containing protein n=1 Tax=Strongyloides papillosus TaxID=174720 RepID=A0A0N5C725_STREA